MQRRNCGVRNYKWIMEEKRKGWKKESKGTYGGKATNAEILGRRRNFDDFIGIGVVIISVFLFLSANNLEWPRLQIFISDEIKHNSFRKRHEFWRISHLWVRTHTQVRTDHCHYCLSLSTDCFYLALAVCGWNLTSDWPVERKRRNTRKFHASFLFYFSEKKESKNIFPYYPNKKNFKKK